MTKNLSMIKFEKESLLGLKELEELLTGIYNTDKADIISKVFEDYLLINNKKTYLFNKTYISYDLIDNFDDEYLKSQIRTLIEHSHKNLTDEQKTIFNLKHPKGTITLFKINFYKEIVRDIIMRLTRNDIEFSNPQISQIHFNNGFFNFESGKFESRIKGKHFIVVKVNRNYKPADIKSKKRLMKILSQIYPNQDDRNYLLMTLGASLTGKVIRDQSNLFLLGLGSTGKSTLMKLISASIELYMLELKEDTFSSGNQKQDKILNSLMANPFVRICWINEMEDKKLDQSLFKRFCEGLITTVSLYKDGVNNFKHLAKLVFTANTFPNIVIDTGTTRRIESFTHSSEFTLDPKLVNESNHIYLADKNLIDEFESNDELKNALFEILAEYGYKWMKNETFPKTKNFDETKATIIGTNDVVQDFIDKHIEITNVDSDRIGKSEMLATFKIMYPKSFMTEIQLIGALKQKRLKYDGDKRVQGIKGAYLGVRYLEAEAEPEEFNNDYLHNKTNSKLTDLEKLLKEKDDLITQLQLQLSQQQNLNKPIQIKTNQDEQSVEELEQELESMLSGVKQEDKFEELTDDDVNAIANVINEEFKTLDKKVKKNKSLKFKK